MTTATQVWCLNCDRIATGFCLNNHDTNAAPVPGEQEVRAEVWSVGTSYCQKCGTMVNFQQQWCDSCTPKLPRWMQDKQWSFNRYSNNPEDKRWCIQPTTGLRPLFFADVPDATTAKQSHDIGRFIVQAVNSHAELKERVRELRQCLTNIVKMVEDDDLTTIELDEARAALSKGK